MGHNKHTKIQQYYIYKKFFHITTTKRVKTTKTTINNPRQIDLSSYRKSSTIVNTTEVVTGPEQHGTSVSSDTPRGAIQQKRIRGSRSSSRKGRGACASIAPRADFAITDGTICISEVEDDDEPVDLNPASVDELSQQLNAVSAQVCNVNKRLDNIDKKYNELSCTMSNIVAIVTKIDTGIESLRREFSNVADSLPKTVPINPGSKLQWKKGQV